MTVDHPKHRFRDWASLIVHLSNNWLTLTGVVLITTAVLFWVLLLPTFLHGHTDNPYVGIVLFMAIPAAFFLALTLMPLGIWLNWRQHRNDGTLKGALPAIDLRNVAVRRLLSFLALSTFANLLIGSQLSYRTVHYMESVSFCGQTCHTVMQPEYVAYQNSPHARVECVKCHIGPGASWFVKSKLDGVRQVIAVWLDTYSRPIPTPVHTLRPARETCEACHWPQKYGEDRVRVIPHYAEDEANTRSNSVLLMRIGHGPTGPGIHGAHLDPGVEIWYRHEDEKRQKIPYVEKRKAGEQTVVYLAEGAKKEPVEGMSMRLMDCMDCHTRPSHSFELPSQAINEAMEAGRIPSALPFVKKKGVEILNARYSSHEEAAVKIPAALKDYYRASHPDMLRDRQKEVDAAGQALLEIYVQNVFPRMNITWGTYPNHIGHNDFPGCFRCHDERTGSNGKTVTQDCNTCHSLLAMEEPTPKILSDLGLISNGAK